jgi:cell division protein FtsW
VLIVAVVALLVLPFSYRRERVFNFVNPEANCQTSGYQACQALIAVGSGGLTGKGLGYGAQAFGYLPEAANDSIFAIMAEKFGFLGMSAVIALFAALFTRLIRILERAPNMTSRLIVTGVLTWLSVQTLINIGAMIGLLPLKGITLPFISYGGTSIIFVLAALGMVFQISRYTTFGVNIEEELGEPGERRQTRESATDWRRNRRPYHSTIGGR